MMRAPLPPTPGRTKEGAAMPTVPRTAMLRAAAFAVALGLTVLAGAAETHAALDTPDAVYYGRVFSSGQPAQSGVVSAGSGTTEIDSFDLGSAGAAPGFYVLRIPVEQS